MDEIIKSVQFYTKTAMMENGIGIQNNFVVGDFTPKQIIEEIEVKDNRVRVYIKNRKEETIDLHEYYGFQFKVVYSCMLN